MKGGGNLGFFYEEQTVFERRLVTGAPNFAAPHYRKDVDKL